MTEMQLPRRIGRSIVAVLTGIFGAPHGRPPRQAGAGWGTLRFHPSISPFNLVPVVYDLTAKQNEVVHCSSKVLSTLFSCSGLRSLLRRSPATRLFARRSRRLSMRGMSPER